MFASLRWALLFLCLFVVCTPSAWSQTNVRDTSLGVAQPNVIARRMPATPMLGIYPGPSGQHEFETIRLKEVAERVYAASFGQDARTARLPIRSEELETIASETSTPSLLLMVRQLELGRRLYRAGDLDDAIEVLEQSLNSNERAYLQFSHPDVLAESLEVLSLAYQELQSDSPQNAEFLEARLRVAMREWIRIRPGQRIDERRYPTNFVEAWRQAYFDQLETSAALLAIRMEEARVATNLLEVDLLLDVRLLHGPRGSSVSVRLYDAIEDRFAYDALLAWDGSELGLEDVLSRAFSAARECVPLRSPAPVIEERRIVKSVTLSGGWSGFAYLDRPTSLPFLNQGLDVFTQVYFSPVIGVYIDGMASFSSRDQDGTLLRPVQTQSTSLGVSFQFERPRYRLFVDGGFDISRRTSIAVTRDFWCRVSGGQEISYGEFRACSAEDVTRSGPSAVLSLKTRAGISVKISGRFWLYTSVWTQIGIAPFEGRILDRPLGAGFGGTYRFGR